MELGLVVSLVIALPLALGVLLRLRSLPRTRQCPSCAQSTLRLRSRAHAAASVLVRSHEIHRRWCPACGWSGSARLASPTHIPSPHEPEQSSGIRVIGAGDTVDVRQVEVAGSHWRVMVQCWRAGGRWVGRLLFVGPGGRAWMEEDWSIAGHSALDVLSRALAIPESSLSGRLRRALLY